MGSCSVTMGTEFTALNPGLRRRISMSHAWHSLLLTHGFSQEVMGCGALISFGHEETPFAVGMRCLGDSTTAATALPALGTSLGQL